MRENTLNAQFCYKKRQKNACKFMFTIDVYLGLRLKSVFSLLFYVLNKLVGNGFDGCKFKYTGLSYAKK